MNFVFPTANATSLPTIEVPKDVAIVAFHQATDAGMYLAKESYQASFTDESITVLTLAKWIRAYNERK
jgi:hypothetical protein